MKDTPRPYQRQALTALPLGPKRRGTHSAQRKSKQGATEPEAEAERSHSATDPTVMQRNSRRYARCSALGARRLDVCSPSGRLACRRSEMVGQLVISRLDELTSIDLGCHRMPSTTCRAYREGRKYLAACAAAAAPSLCRKAGSERSIRSAAAASPTSASAHSSSPSVYFP